MCLAIYHCDLSVIRFLLERKADPNVSWIDMDRDIILTPLRVAAMQNREAVVSLLVEYGAEINAPNQVRYLILFQNV